MIATLLAVAFALEWNPTYRTDIPYEVEINPAKLGVEKAKAKGEASRWRVLADGKALETMVLEGVAPGTISLRFQVPAGTKSLTCSTANPQPSTFNLQPSTFNLQPSTFNLFAGAFDAANAGKWKCGNGIKATPGNGIVFATDGKRGGEVAYEVEIPETLAGVPVMQEIEVKNLTPLVWGGKTYIEQLDANGKVLPETVADIRWTSHMRPSDKLMTYRNEGHIHLKARRLRFVAQVRNVSSDYDAYGHQITDLEMKRGKLALTRLSLRVAERLPFPKWNDSFFGEGVSGEAGDKSFRLGGKARRAMFFQGDSRASWSQRHEFDDDADRALPAGEGTVEAWFKPDWKNCKAKAVTLFDAYHGYSAATHEKPKGSMLRLDYEIATKTFKIVLQDYLRHKFSGEAKGVEFADGKWTHLALQWQPGGVAELYVDGKKRGSVEIGDFQAVPLKDKALLKKLRSLNDAWAYEFFFGASCQTARLSDGGGSVYFEGEGDALRVSHAIRYHGDFTPSKRPQVDAETGVYFSFDRVFDGVMGGGFGFIPASVRADEDRVEHKLKVEDKVVQYYPDEILPENDPAKVLDKYNFKVMPTDEDCTMARVLKTKRVTSAKPNDRIVITAAEKVYPAYTEFRNLSKTEPLRYPIAVAEGRLDPRSFGDMKESLGNAALSDRDRVNRVFQFMLSASDYFGNYQIHFYPGGDQFRSVCYEAMVVVNSYCGFECGPLNNMTANMLSTVAGCPAGVTGGYGHEFEQVFYDGKNHIYDLSAQKFFPAFDNETAAYLKEMGDQPGLKQRGYGSPDHFIRKGARGCWVNAPSYQEKCAMIVNPGETLRVSYSNFGTANNLQTHARKGLFGGGISPCEQDYGKVVGIDSPDKWIYRKDRIFTQRAGAAISFDGVPTKENPAFCDFAADGFSYRVKSCYPIVWGEYSAKLKQGGNAAFAISMDGGKTYRELPSEKGVARSEYIVKGRLEYLVRVKAPIASVSRFASRTETEVNARTYPGWVMKGGRNEFAFKADSGVADITFAWREDAKPIVVEGEVSSGTIPGCERSLVLVDPEKPVSEFKVSGIGAKATARTFGKLDAVIRDGTLKLRYQPKKPAVIRRGDDDPEPRAEFPQFAAVDIVDGEAVKTITVLIARGARLAIAEDPVMPNSGAVKSLKFEPIPAGRYAMFALGRYNAQAEGVTRIDFSGPGPDGKAIPWDVRKKNMRAYNAHRYRNDSEEYLKAEFGQKGRRCRWKWDMASNNHGKNATCNYRIFDFPVTDHLDFNLPWANKAKGEFVELKAVLVIPEPNMDFFLDARKILFGYNTDPFHLN